MESSRPQKRNEGKQRGEEEQAEEIFPEMSYIPSTTFRVCFAIFLRMIHHRICKNLKLIVAATRLFCFVVTEIYKKENENHFQSLSF
jgi:hypothetical protein